MIDKSLVFLLGELNGFLSAVHPSNEARAVLSGLVSLEGQPVSGIENRVVLSVINIERETAAQSQGGGMSSAGGPAPRISQPLNLNLYILVSAAFTAYDVSLRFLSAAMGFLNSKPVFTPQNSASFPRGLERLSVEMVNVGMQDLQNLWSSIGAKYVPSVFYKARMVTIQDGWVTERTPVVSGTDTKV